ncbi:MAG: DUF1616 domain-containing protein [Candidatus Bathyarchaeia archaeon]
MEELVLQTLKSGETLTLSELVNRLREKHGLKFEEAAKTVYILWKKGLINLSEPKQPNTILNYALSLRSLWFWTVSATLLITVAVVFLVESAPLIYIRYVLGSIYVLYLPGSMLIEALYPRGEDLEPLERMALSIGLSLAVVPLIGLILNYTPWGIRLTPTTLSLAIFTEAMAILALARKYIYFRLSLKASEETASQVKGKSK